MTELRSYQEKAVADFYSQRGLGKHRIIMVAPTRSGKTVIGAAIIKIETAAYRNVLVLAHRREIITQTSQKLHDYDIYHGIIGAGFDQLARPLAQVQIALIQTLTARAVRRSRIELPPADLLVIDECHHTPAQSYRKIIEQYPDATILGLTATPCRGDGRGLGGIFETIIEAPQIAELIEQGHLVKTRVYAPINPDLKGVKTVAGDYNEVQLADRMDRPQLVGDIVTHWLKYGQRRRTVAFTVTVAHSIHLRDKFIEVGARAEHIDGSTPKPERDATLKRLASGEIEVVTNCMVLTEGWDTPEVARCILARPTKKMGLFRQMIGRVLRPAPGKSDAIILDHSGAVFKHGLPEDRVEWTLHQDRRAESPAHKARENGKGFERGLLDCSQCGALREAGKACFHCGFLPERPPRAFRVHDGELGLVGAGRKIKSDLDNPAVRREWHAMLAYIACERGYQPGWVAHKFKEKFGVFPAWGAAVSPIPPSAEVRSWVRSRMIAYAKGRRRGAA